MSKIWPVIRPSFIDFAMTVRLYMLIRNELFKTMAHPTHTNTRTRKPSMCMTSTYSMDLAAIVSTTTTITQDTSAKTPAELATNHSSELTAASLACLLARCVGSA